MNHKNMLVSAYLTGQPDPQSGQPWPNDNPEILRNWAESIARVGLHGVILHDGLAPALIEAWTSDHLVFWRYDWRTSLSTNDERFFMLRDWLADHPVEKVIFTDLGDVEFFADPFSLVADERLYVGSEYNWRIDDNPYMVKKFAENYDEMMHGDRLLLNPGVLGGRHETLLRFLYRFTDELFYGAVGNDRNMTAFNHVIYGEQWDFVTGPPLHTRFKQFETAGAGCAIRHK